MGAIKNKTTTVICFIAALFCFWCIFFSKTVYADSSDLTKTAYLYFYTVDGEEITKLQKQVGSKKTYTFKNPDEWKYLPVDSDSKEKVYPELYYQVTGIHWAEVNENGDTIKEYKQGDTFQWSAGNHYFYVKTDNPVLTGENTVTISFDHQVHLYFQNVNGDEIYSLTKSIAPKDEYTFEDPADYAYLFESGDDADATSEIIESNEGLTGNGIGWYCMDENDKEYFFKEGMKARFKEGEYYFTSVTDDPVTITQYYPIDVPTYYVTEQEGGVYSTETVIPGETVTLKKSLGALIWEATMKGWEEEETGELYDCGDTYKVMRNKNVNFYAYYEYDEDWDPNAVDENTGEKAGMKEEINVADIGAINEAAGAGYNVTIDAAGLLKRTGNRTKVNSDVAIEGIPGKIKKRSANSSLKYGGDEKNPEDYTKDKYGNNIEDSNLPVEINSVLKQDDSALYMDVYGNSMVYYSDLTKKNNLLLALDRLSLGKTDSWVNNVSNWDSESIKRFEAVEFALLCGAYPDTQEVKDALAEVGIEWNDSYCSKSAFNKMLPFKKIWTGWYDTYTDGLHEKYKSQDENGTVIVGSAKTVPSSKPSHGLFGITAYAGQQQTFAKAKEPQSLKDRILSLFCVKAYAKKSEQKNPVGEAFQVKGRVNVSLDVNGITFTPQYYDPSRMTTFGTYSFGGLTGLTEEQITVMTKVYNALTGAGYSPEFAAGACGNLWQESHFNTSLVSSAGYIGLVQWDSKSRGPKLKSHAINMWKDWTDPDAQISFMLTELEGYSGYFSSALKKYNGKTDYKSVDDVQLACDLWAAVYEGCVCSNAAHSMDVCPAFNGKRYQELAQRRKYAQQIYQAKRGNGLLSIDPNGYSVPNNQSNNKVPYYAQSGGQPWSDLPFGDGTIATSGCSLTSLSMLISYQLGSWVHPSDVYNKLIEVKGDYNAFHVKGTGQNCSGLYSTMASAYGLKYKSLPSMDAVLTELRKGNPVAMSTKKGTDGYFTKSAHIIVLTGVDAAGNIYVNDPNSSHQAYSYQAYSSAFISKYLNSGYYTVYKD